MDSAVYGNGLSSRFEGLDVVIPERYDEYFSAYYGDWRADLPEEQKKGHHYYEIVDCEKSYVDYIRKISCNRRKIKLNIVKTDKTNA